MPTPFFDTPLKIREMTLPHRAVFGPMAGFTDAPCRDLMAAHGAGYTVSEMVSTKAIVYSDHKTIRMIKAEKNEAPYGVQLFGAEVETFAEATQQIQQYAYDFIDINMGCPAPKIVGGGVGGAGCRLMFDPALCGKITEAVVKNSDRPVTVKMRKGWDDAHITAVECAKACEAAGAAAVAVHARTKEQMYTPGIDLSIIEAVKNAVKIPVFGNGDITSGAAALEMVDKTGCDGIMIARGSLGNPWLFEEVNAALEGKEPPKAPNLQARMNALRRQITQMVAEKGEWTAMPQARAQALHYMKGLRGAAALRKAACSLQYLDDVERLIEEVFEAQRRAETEADVEIPFP